MKRIVIAACILLVALSISNALPQLYGPSASYYGPGSYGPPSNPAIYRPPKKHASGHHTEYTVKDPYGQNTMRVKEMHVQMNHQMDADEAEAALKDIMGSMHSGGTGIESILKDFGF
ncbi:uncharacterized protein LOC143230217 [Tachypleus tridentatus]|uniref:uncharacterized protein LOC143230217 n=1 Tax=Tachypleus tridentatus TaxID=6853 RepID=UPI003FD52655